MHMVGICIDWVALEISSTHQLAEIPQQDEGCPEIVVTKHVNFSVLYLPTEA